MRDAAFVVAAAFPVLATVALAVVLVAAAAIAVVPHCCCRAALALATTVKKLRPLTKDFLRDTKGQKYSNDTLHTIGQIVGSP